MKNIKKLLSILMVLTLVLALGANAFAATVKIDKPVEGHTYVAYQIFSGTTATVDGKEKLASIDWAEGVDSVTLLTALAADTTISGVTFSESMTAEEAAEAMSTLTSYSEGAKALARVLAANTASLGAGKTIVDGEAELDPGYYAIVDETEVDGDPDSKNAVVLEVVGSDVTVDSKYDVPISQKKVQDVNDTTGVGGAWQDSADYDIGDEVPFKITGALPSNLGEYATYELIFHDVQSEGLTFDPDSVNVTVGGQPAAKGTDYTVVVPAGEATALEDGCTFEIRFTDIKTVAGAAADAEVVVTYNSTLNDNAVIGKTGNPNTMSMEFSNNPSGTGTGKTPDDTVIVFTYQLTVNKQDGDGKELGNAAFTLFKKVESAPKGANVLKSLKGDDGEPAELKVGDYYQPEEGGTIYQIVGTSTSAADKYTFDFKGLDDGSYLLVETTVPDGYNKADDIEFTITADHDVESANPALYSFKATGDGISVDETKKDDTVVNGLITTNVKNMSGLELPETGGIGTTIFYVVGGILVVAAVILLVTRRRVSGSEK